MTGRPLICLAGSGGGHVRQLLDLKPLWAKHSYFFVTENTAMGRSVAEEHDTQFVPHFALGQAGLGNISGMLRNAARSVVISWRIIAQRRPNFVITTGAGSLLFITLFARLFGAKIVLIDSFARFQAPSAFARLAGPLAHLRCAQSEACARAWGNAKAFDPLRPIDSPKQQKEMLLFATVGATLPFERLMTLVLSAKLQGQIAGRVVLQIGDYPGAIAPAEGVEIVRELPFAEIEDLLARADTVICHGGTGSIITALKARCKVIVIPRVRKLGEHYDDHQSEITESFVQRGLVLTAHDSESLGVALEAAKDFTPQPVITDYKDLIAELDRYIIGERDPAD